MLGVKCVEMKTVGSAGKGEKNREGSKGMKEGKTQTGFVLITGTGKAEKLEISVRHTIALDQTLHLHIRLNCCRMVRLSWKGTANE